MRRGWTIGVDVGGTNIKCGLVDARGRVVSSCGLSSTQFGAPDALVEAVRQTVERLAQPLRGGLRALCGVGIGAPGLVDATRGLVHTLVNIPGWRNVALAAQLKRRVRRPVFVDNDVNVMALGEQRFGAGRGVRHLVCLTLGTGVGGGLIFDGQLYRGVSGSAGELGHIVVNPHGRRCACGARGCLEAQIGTAAILALARQAMRHGSQPLCRLATAARMRLTPELVASAARAGDRAAQRIWREVGQWLGLGLSSVVNLLNPERIVIGGGVANAWSLFAPTMVKTLRAHAMAVPQRSVRVVRARLGDQAGILGAAVLVWNELKR